MMILVDRRHLRGGSDCDPPSPARHGRVRTANSKRAYVKRATDCLDWGVFGGQNVTLGTRILRGRLARVLRVAVRLFCPRVTWVQACRRARSLRGIDRRGVQRGSEARLYREVRHFGPL